MHYYSFNIGDYFSHTSHLDQLEDLAYRRMLDYCYLNEIGLPENKSEIGRLIRMRTDSDCIANVLREFFTLEDGVYYNKRVEVDIQAYREKSKKAANSANVRWAKTKGRLDANALRPKCEGNANHKPITNNQEPVTKKQSNKRFTPPSIQEVTEYCLERKNSVDPATFIDHYETNGWMRGKTKIKDWKACVRTWEKNANEKGNRSNFKPNQADEALYAKYPHLRPQRGNL